MELKVWKIFTSTYANLDHVKEILKNKGFITIYAPTREVLWVYEKIKKKEAKIWKMR